MGIIQFILITILIINIGFLLGVLIKKTQVSFLENMLLAFPMGLGIVIVFIFLASPVAGLQEAFWFISLVGLFVGLIFRKVYIEIFHQLNNLLSSVKKIKITFVRISLIAILLSLLFGVLFRNALVPIDDWDALASYDFHARVFYAANSINPDSKGIQFLGYRLGKPPFTSAMHVMAYWSFGPVNQGKIYYSILFISLLLIIFYNLIRTSSLNYALLGTIVFATTPLLGQAQIAYTNFPFSCYLILSIIYFQKWIDTRTFYFAFVGVLFFFISLWVRPEFYLFHIITAVVMFFIFIKKKKNKKRLIMPIILLFIVNGGMKLWNIIADFHLNKINLNYTKLFLSEKDKILSYNPPSLIQGITDIRSYSLSRVWEVIPFSMAIFLNAVGIYFLLFLMLSIVDYQTVLKKNQFIFLWIITSVLAFFGGTYLFSILFYLEWQDIAGSAARMISFLPPLLVFYFFSILNIKSLENMTAKLFNKISNLFIQDE